MDSPCDITQISFSKTSQWQLLFIMIYLLDLSVTLSVYKGQIMFPLEYGSSYYFCKYTGLTGDFTAEFADRKRRLYLNRKKTTERRIQA